MGAELLGRVPIAREFGLGEHGMDLVVADLMDEHRGAVGAALHPGDEVMDALPRGGRDGPEAERADGIARFGVGVLGGLHERQG